MLTKCKKLQKNITETIFKKNGNNTYAQAFAELSELKWGRVLGRLLEYMTAIDGLPKIIEELDWKIERLTKQINRVPFNCPNKNLALGRLEKMKELLELKDIRKQHYDVQHFMFDLMERIQKVMNSSTKEGQILSKTLCRVMDTNPRYQMVFEQWWCVNLSHKKLDLATLLENSYDANLRFNEIRANPYKT